MRKYYRVTFSPKSHNDYPSAQYTEYFTSRNQEEYENKLNRIIHGSEDWNVQEIGQKHYELICF